MSEFDVNIHYTENDIEKVQNKTNWFLQKYGDLGVFHLYKEGAQNVIDEYEDPKCIKFLKSIGEGKKKRVLKTTYDKLTDKVTIEDSGRGIPEDDYSVEVVCTKLQSGSKFQRDQGGKSSGEFGLGITIVNALSKEFSISTYRNNYYHTVRFENGKKVEEIKEPVKKTGKKHGTIISFISDPKYLGAGSHLPIDVVKDWLEDMSYQVADGIEFVVEEWDGLTLEKTTTFKKKPFSELIMKFIPAGAKVGFGPLSLKGEGKHLEEITQHIVDKKGVVKDKVVTMEKDVNLEFAFVYDQGSMESDFISYCNFTKTDDGGVHIDAVEEALCRYLQKQAKNSLTEAQQAKWDITFNDVRAGLKMVVNLSTNAQVDFMGNAKTKIQNESLKPLLKTITTDAITEYFEKNSGLGAVCKIIVANARARIEMQKVKDVSIQKRYDVFSEYDIPNLIRANNTGNKYREIILIEGRKSAAGAIRNARDPYTQAIFGFRGQTANPFKSSTDITNNDEWRQYIRALRCGYGPTFDINKLYYKKIIIGMDADVDGAGISVGVAAYHALKLPKIVEGGFLYKVYPPLYALDSKTNPFIRTKPELTELLLKETAKVYKIRISDSGEYFKNDELWEFLYDTIDYRLTLIGLYDFYKVNRWIIEIIGASLVRFGAVTRVEGDYVLKEGILEDPKFIRNFMQAVQKRYPEASISGDKVHVIADGKRYQLKLNSRLLNKMADLIPIFEKYGCMLGVKEKGKEDEILSIGEFLDQSYKLQPNIINRFKGLGEADPDQLWPTTLNPETRCLVRLTFGDIERDMRIFMKLKSDKLAFRAERKRMMESYKIRREDLDT